MTTQTSQPPRSWKPLLVIPAAIVLAKAVAHRRMRWAAEADAGGTLHRQGHGHGHGRRFGVQADGSVHLPPKLDEMLGAWHAQAHAADPTDSPATEA